MSTATLSPVKQARRTRILDAAEALFLSQGLRATTMEGVAAAVGMSKVTVYAYFKDKDALFAAVADRFAERMAGVVDAALSANGPVVARVADALVAKHGLVSGRVRASAFAGELFGAKNRLSRQRFQTLDAEIIARLGAVLRDPDLAHLMFHASQGIANNTTPWARAARDIRRLVQGLLTHTP